MTCRQPRRLSRGWNFAAESSQNSGRGTHLDICCKPRDCLFFRPQKFTEDDALWRGEERGPGGGLGGGVGAGHGAGQAGHIAKWEQLWKIIMDTYGGYLNFWHRKYKELVCMYGRCLLNSVQPKQCLALIIFNLKLQFCAGNSSDILKVSLTSQDEW